MTAEWSILTPTAGAGALAVVQIAAGSGTELDAALDAAGLPRAEAGDVRVRDLMGADRGVMIRWSPECLHLYPHGGEAVLRMLTGALTRAGLTRSQAPDARRDYPEAADDIEARMLAALARAASPLAIDALLAQPDRWRRRAPASPWSRELRRLIDPALVVAMGPPNVGKSTLANTLAGRAVSIVADEPGTTRDHVGVVLDFAGLVVRYVDTPGLARTGATREEQEAVAIALDLAARADLLVLCGDAANPPPAVAVAGRESVRVCLRRDLGPPEWACDASVSALRGEGLGELVVLVRERLVPDAALRHEGSWAFWE